MRPLRQQYGHTPANEFGPLRLAAVRESMVGAGLSRRVINQRVGRIKRVFKWATAKQLVPPTVYHGLQAVAGLGQGRTQAPDPTPVEPVADDVVEKTLPHLPRHVRGLVQFMPDRGPAGRACQLRRCDIDSSATSGSSAGSAQDCGGARGDRFCRGPRPRLLAEFRPTTRPTLLPGRPPEQFAASGPAQDWVQPSQVCRAKCRQSGGQTAVYAADSLPGSRWACEAMAFRPGTQPAPARGRGGDRKRLG